LKTVFFGEDCFFKAVVIMLIGGFLFSFSQSLDAFELASEVSAGFLGLACNPWISLEFTDDKDELLTLIVFLST
jgi:hypothetical protein